MIHNLNGIINTPSTSIAKCALFQNDPTYARDLQVLFDELHKQKQDSFYEFLDQFDSESIQKRIWSAGISPEVQSILSRNLSDIIPILSLLIVLSACQGIPNDVTYVLAAISRSSLDYNIPLESLLQCLSAQHTDLSKFILNIHHSLTDWPIFITRFKSYFKEILIPESVGEYHVKMVLIRETTIYLSKFFNCYLQPDHVDVIRTIRTAKRVCPRCIHGVILLATSTRINNLPDPIVTPVCDLIPENFQSTLYPDEDQAADFMLTLYNYGLTLQHLTHFSPECPLICSEILLARFSQQYIIPLKQLISFKREVIKLMCSNKICAKCGKEYSGSKYPPIPEHTSCSFWDNDTSSISIHSKFISTNIKSE
ncbi:hypothetical protein LOD99_14258 [Oopsacas minuta]|uniref:Uncharacterized protein n=1 Tax=Oopsacas minuta TaxID=111878 RepID=A0AAV7KGA5_9METZ|nr:hypothetical protein LOD99_14258 [Oopsacas minuta]